MKRQHKHNHIITDIDRSEGVELSLAIHARSPMQAIPVIPRVRHGRTLKYQTQAVREQRQHMDEDEHPDGPTEPHSHGGLAPDPEVELQDADAGDHDQSGVKNGKNEELLDGGGGKSVFKYLINHTSYHKVRSTTTPLELTCNIAVILGAET